jgi:hypothetical protein
MLYIPDSEATTGYRVKVFHKPAFKVTGFTRIIPPDEEAMVPQFWDELEADGRLAKLRACANRPWLLGLGTWDRECEKRGYRYTVCIEATADANFTGLAQDYALFTKDIDETDWLSFEVIETRFENRFWQDDPYVMLKKLGYKFNNKGFNLGLHFDAYPPDFDMETNPLMEFWITVRKPV